MNRGQAWDFPGFFRKLGFFKAKRVTPVICADPLKTYFNINKGVSLSLWRESSHIIPLKYYPKKGFWRCFGFFFKIMSHA